MTINLKEIRERVEKANNGTYDACKDGHGLSFEVRAMADIPALLAHIDKLTKAANKLLSTSIYGDLKVAEAMKDLDDVLKEATDHETPS